MNNTKVWVVFGIDGTDTVFKPAVFDYGDEPAAEEYWQLLDGELASEYEGYPWNSWDVYMAIGEYRRGSGQEEFCVAPGDGTGGQDRDNYTDDQDRENYVIDEDYG